MVNIVERNMDMLNYEVENKELRDKIVENIICPNGLLNDFNELTYEACTEHYRLYKEIYSDSINRNVLVYLIEDEDDIAFMSQAYNIPGRDVSDVEFVIFISEHFLIDNEVAFNCILGHELAHIDFYNLPKYNSHGAQDRYPFIEVYCDIKGFEFVNDKDAIKDNIQTIKKQIGIAKLREIELRFTFIRLFLKGLVDSEFIRLYIEKNYLKHMDYLEKVVEHHDEVIYNYKVNERKRWSKDIEHKFIEYGVSLLTKYIV